MNKCDVCGKKIPEERDVCEECVDKILKAEIDWENNQK